MVATIRAVPIGAGLVRLAGVLVGALVASVLSSSVALAQVSPNATVTPVRNTGGFVYIMAFLMAVAGVIVVVVLAAMYLRYAPRFQRTEGGGAARADRIVPGREPPRRAVDVSQAAPVVVAPPAVPVAAAAAPAPARAAPAAAAPAAPAPAAAPAATAAPAAPAPSPAPAAPPSEGAAPAPAAAREHADVELDQEVFDAKLAELLQAGTDRRVAEGQARRAAMIAARKKAEG
jgi:nucleoid-associated protein YgaU